VIHRLARRVGRRWKWILKAMDVVEEKATRILKIQRWI